MTDIDCQCEYLFDTFEAYYVGVLSFDGRILDTVEIFNTDKGVAELHCFGEDDDGNLTVFVWRSDKVSL